MGALLQDGLADWTVGRNITLTLTLADWYPCGGAFEYLHRDPASRRRRRKGKSQIWDSKIWSRDSNDSDSRKTTLVKASSICKRHTRPLVREGAPEKQDHNCQNVGLDTKTYWLIDPQSQCNFDFDFDFVSEGLVVEKE
jgi:hypothetical protein